MSFYTIPISYVPAQDTNVDYVFKLTEITIAKLTAPEQVAFWSDLSADGGNLRLFADAGKVTGLPVEVVIVDAGAQILEIWARLNSPLLASGGQNIYLETIVTGDPVLSGVSSPLGKYAVWSDYALVAHLVVDGRDSTNNYTFSAGSDEAPTFSRALGMTMNNSRPRYFKRAAGELIEKFNYTFTMDLNIVSVVEANINGIVLDRTGDGLPIISGESTPRSFSRLVIAIQQGPPCSPPTPVTPSLRGLFFGGYGPAFAGFDENGSLKYENTTTLAGELKDEAYRAAGESLLMSGSYDITEDPVIYSGFLGEWRFYRDGVQTGFNTTFLNRPYPRSRINDNSFTLSANNCEWSLKEWHIRNVTLNAAYEAAQQVNRNDEANFFGLATVEPVNPPDPPEPPLPPGPPPTSDQDIQAW